MDLSMILNNEGDGGYASSPYPSPRVTNVPASTRWSVDEMRSAVAILSDFPETANGSQIPNPSRHRVQYRQEVDDDETEDELDHLGRRRQPAAPAPPSAGFSGLDLLFQADAMIQKRASPEIRASGVDKVPKKSKRTKFQPKMVRPGDDDNDDLEEEDDDDGSLTPLSSLQYLRSGFWTRAEEEYAAALIFYFLRGALPIAEGTTLRKYLAEQLSCNRRRVSMKLATETIADKKIPRKVGASVFVSLKPAQSDADQHEVLAVLDRLRRDCFREADGSGGGGEADRTPRQTSVERATREKQPVSPLLLGAKHAKLGSRSGSPRAVPPQATPARRKPRRPSVASSAKASPPSAKRRRPTIIRTGFDSPHEEELVTALVEYFTDGVLELRDGTRLVTYLCEQLECSPKTLSMKLAPRKMGERKFPESIGSITYTRKGEDDSSSEMFEAEAHVFELRQNWLQAREEAETQGWAHIRGEGQTNDDDVDEQEEEIEGKASAATSPVSTPSRRVKTEMSTSAAAAASLSSTPTTKSPNNAPRSYSRSGPWSRHEEEYAAGLIDCFFRGVLDITEGTTLRAFLTSRLNCNPMRISKKLASHTIADVKIPKKLGSATYVRRDGVVAAERKSAEEHLRHLEHKSLSEQHLKEDIVMGVIGHKHTREDEEEPKSEPSHARSQHPYDHHNQHHHSQPPPMHRRPYSDGSSPMLTAAAVSPGSPFKMRRVIVDDYSAAREPVVVMPALHHRSSPPGAYDHHDASMRYQRVAY